MDSGNFPKDSDHVVMNNITFTHEDIRKVVDDFYTRIQHDDILSVPFQSVHDWPEHIHKLTHFWWVRLGGRPYMAYRYNPIEKHFFAGFNRTFLSRWLSIFSETQKTHLKKDQYELWTLMSTQMGKSLAARNDYLVNEHQANSPKS